MIRNTARGMTWLFGVVYSWHSHVTKFHFIIPAAGWLRRYYDGMMWSSLFVPWRGAKEDHIVKVSGCLDDDGMDDGWDFLRSISIHWLAAQFMKSIFQCMGSCVGGYLGTHLILKLAL